MQRYDEAVDVRTEGDAPSQFLWRGRLWQVRSVVSHRAVADPSRPWWTSPEVRSVVAAEGPSPQTIEECASRTSVLTATLVPTLAPSLTVLDDHPGEQEVWRVHAHCPARAGRLRLRGEETGLEVFDLVLSPTSGCWRLIGAGPAWRTGADR